VSLDAAVGALDDISTLADRLADPEAIPLDIAVIDAIEHARLRDALHAISDEVREILALHWGLMGGPPWSVRQIGQHVGREASEVDAIIQGSLGALQAVLNPAHPEALDCTQSGGFAVEARSLYSGERERRGFRRQAGRE
jgi:DNA-directed RNA polymerase sigma subunit (sigma70/sigma32)